MENQITQKFIDILGPITDDRLYFGNFSLDASFNNDAMFKTPGVVALTDEQRQQVEQLIIDHYKVEKVLWMDLPSGLTPDGKETIVAQTHKLMDTDTLYKGKTAYVYQITFSPKMYDPKTIHTPVKDGCAVTPLLFNPENFIPSKKIILEFSPEYTQEILTDEDMKQHLREKLEKVLANPQEYEHQGFRACMLRFAAK